MAVAVRGSNGSSSRSTSPNGHQNGGHDNGHNKGPRRIKVGVIGCGYWGPQLIRNIHEMADAELVGVADTKPERLEFVRRHYPEVKLFSSHTQLLETDVEAVVVSTPIHTHHMLAKEALTAGKHVMVEKPLAASVSESVELINIAQARNLMVMVGHTFLYNPAVQELRRLVGDGELGRIYYVDAARLNLGLFQRRANVIWDLAPHDISILMYVLGMTPVAVSARGSMCVQDDVYDVAYLELLFESGVSAHVHVSWLDPAKVRRITVVGDKKMAVYNDVSLVEKIRVYDTGVESPVTNNFGEFQLSYRHGQVTIPYITWQEPLRLECEHFIECIRTGADPRTDGMQGLAVVSVLEAASDSLMHGGRRVPVEIPSLTAAAPAAAPVGVDMRTPAQIGLASAS
jgi:predicted dehydrogenase